VGLVELDSRLFSRVGEIHTPWLDSAMRGLTRAADHSKLWIAIAGGLPLVDHRRGRRAALRGIGCVVATSLVVNQGIKRAVRRPRPSLRRIPVVRRLHAQPLTTSFPSGHAASAAAFATAATLEWPAAGVPLAGLAAAVGYSRVHVGVHYPLDVAAGAAIGAGVSALSALQWPVLPRAADAKAPTAEAVRLQPRPDGIGLTLIINAESGAPLRGVSVDELRERFPRARVIELDDPGKLAELVQEAAAGCEILGVSGGDGSAAAAAHAALEHDLPLLLLPTGTLNHLARDLRLDGAQAALEAFERGEAVAIDVGEVDGRPFVNALSFGGYTTMLDVRDRLEKRIGRWPAHVIAIVRALAGAEPVEVTIDGVRRRLWMAHIGNCRHEPAGFAPTWRPRLDDGVLDVRLLTADRPLARLRLVCSILTGRLTRCPAYEQLDTSQLSVEAADGSRLRLALDGEALDRAPRFSVRKRPRRLIVYTPAR
jgi:undecaprenyl-diphosphatase